MNSLFMNSTTVFSAFRQRIDFVSDVPYYMTITVSGPIRGLDPETTDYAIALEIIYV